MKKCLIYFYGEENIYTICETKFEDFNVEKGQKEIKIIVQVLELK